MIAHKQPLCCARLCFYVGEITPPQEFSCACFQLAHFSSNPSHMIYFPALFPSLWQGMPPHPGRRRHQYDVERKTKVRLLKEIKKTKNIKARKLKAET